VEAFNKLKKGGYKARVASLFVLIGFVFTFLFVYQNCGKVRFASVQPTDHVECAFSGAQIMMAPSSGIRPGDQVSFSVDNQYFDTIQWTFKKGAATLATASTNPAIQSFSEAGSDYLAVADLSKGNGSCGISLQRSFQVSNSSVCLDPSGINGPITGYVGQGYDFSTDAQPCFAGVAQWNMDYKINGVVNNNSVEFTNPAMTPVHYTYTNSGTYTIRVDILNTATNMHVILTHDIQISFNSCTLPWGGQIPHLGTVAGWNYNQASCGQTCESNILTCNNGVLSGVNGIYTHQSCVNATGCSGGCTNGATNYPTCNQCAAGQFLETNINNPSDKFCAHYGQADGEWCHAHIWTQFWCRTNGRPDAARTCTGDLYAPGWWILQPSGCYHRNLGTCNGADANSCEIYNHVDIVRVTNNQVAYTRQLTLAELQSMNPGMQYCPNEPRTPYAIPNTCSPCPTGSILNSNGQCICTNNNQPPVNGQCPITTCTNGAVNPPACNQCPAGQSFINGICQTPGTPPPPTMAGCFIDTQQWDLPTLNMCESDGGCTTTNAISFSVGNHRSATTPNGQPGDNYTFDDVNAYTYTWTGWCAGQTTHVCSLFGLVNGNYLATVTVRRNSDGQTWTFPIVAHKNTQLAQNGHCFPIP
jgi:hypothetical protein